MSEQKTKENIQINIRNTDGLTFLDTIDDKIDIRVD